MLFDLPLDFMHDGKSMSAQIKEACRQLDSEVTSTLVSVERHADLLKRT